MIVEDVERIGVADPEMQNTHPENRRVRQPGARGGKSWRLRKNSTVEEGPPPTPGLADLGLSGGCPGNGGGGDPVSRIASIFPQGSDDCNQVPAPISCQVFTLAGCGANGTRRKVKTRIYEAGAGVK